MRIGIIMNDGSEKGFLKIKERGLSFGEICCNSEQDMKGIVAEKEGFKERIAKTGIDVSSVGRWCHDVQQEGKLVPEKVQAYIDLLDAAEDMGAKTFVTGCNYDKTVSKFRNYANAVDFFGMLTEHAKDMKIKVAVANCDWANFITSPADWDIVFGENPDLYLKFDASHAYNRGQDYLAQLSNYADKVVHFHLKGVTKAGMRLVDDPPAGMDDLNWPAMFSILYSNKYDGDLSIEPHSNTWKGELGEAGIAFTIDYISKFLF